MFFLSYETVANWIVTGFVVAGVWVVIVGSLVALNRRRPRRNDTAPLCDTHEDIGVNPYRPSLVPPGQPPHDNSAETTSPVVIFVWFFTIAMILFILVALLIPAVH